MLLDSSYIILSATLDICLKQHTTIINIVLFVLKVQPNTTFKHFARKKKQIEVHSVTVTKITMKSH